MFTSSNRAQSICMMILHRYSMCDIFFHSDSWKSWVVSKFFWFSWFSENREKIVIFMIFRNFRKISKFAWFFENRDFPEKIKFWKKYYDFFSESYSWKSFEVYKFEDLFSNFDFLWLELVNILYPNPFIIEVSGK